MAVTIDDQENLPKAKSLTKVYNVSKIHGSGAAKMHGTATDAALTASREETWHSGQVLMALFTALAFFAEGMGTQAMGLALPAIIKDWALPRAALASATAIGMAGFALGAVLGGFCGDRFGRRPSLIFSLALLGVSTAACGLTNNTAELGLVRFFVGLGLGASLPSAAALIAESSPLRHRSVVIAVGLAFLPLGGFANGLIAGWVLPHFGWRGLFAITGALSLLFAVALGAYGLIWRARAGAAAFAEQRTRSPFHTSLRGLVAAPARRDTLGLWGAFFFTVLIYYSVFSWLPTVLSSVGWAVPAASGAISAFALGGLFGGLMAGWFSQSFGTRAALWILSSGAAAGGAVLAAASHFAPADATQLLAGIALLGAAVIGIQTTLFALGAHVYDGALRSTGTGVAVGWGRVGAIASSFTGVASLDRGGPPGFFLFLAVAAVLALVCGLRVGRQIPGRGL
jgi:AAHS family 4-hydroxybenzoate transporter-like MFS transporter